MNEIWKPRLSGQRRAIALVLGAIVGAGLIAGFERCQPRLRAWLLSAPAETASRSKLVLLLLAAALCLPLLAFVIYLWLRAAHNAPAGAERIAGERRRYLRILAVCLGSAAALLGVLMWRLAFLFER